jgi:hypothetical protein
MMSPAAEASEIQSGTITVIARGEQNAASSVTKIYADVVEHPLPQPASCCHQKQINDRILTMAVWTDEAGPAPYYPELRIPYRNNLCFKASCKLGASCLAKCSSLPARCAIQPIGPAAYRSPVSTC